jgi:hypothetical protein
LQHGTEQQLGLALHRRAQVAVEIARLGTYVFQLAQEQPLTREIRHERLGARVGDHPPYLLLQRFRILQTTARSQRHELVVRDAAPQEEGQP